MSTLAACGGQTRDGEDSMPMPVTTIGGDGSTGAADEGEGEGETEYVPTDLGNPDFDPDGGVGCNAVDFLFVIDNSGSMADEQQHLIDSVPGFVDSIVERLPPGSGTFHIMVTDVDAWVYDGCPDACIESAACEQSSMTGECDCGYPCALRDLCTAGGQLGGNYECGEAVPDNCDAIMGAGVAFPIGRDASNVDCEFASGKRYMTNTEPDLASAFDCAARVGTNSTVGEKPMLAMVEALSVSGPAAACNDGFLRDDAVLVVTIITDEDDNGPHAEDLEGDSPGTVDSWYADLVQAKNGNEQAIVALALIGDTDQPGGICAPLDHSTYEGAEPAPRIREFVGRFGDRGHVASVCAPSYEEFFMTAVETIGKACDEFVPEQ